MLIRENVPEGRKLNPRIKARWFLERLLGVLPLFAAMAVLLYLVGYTEGELNPLFIAAFLIAIALVSMALYAEVELRYRKFVYALREKDFLIQKGIVEKIRYVIPYEKIQNVTVSRDFLEVALGLGTLHIETAAHIYVENDIILPGVSNDSDLVNELVERSKAAKEGAPQAKESADALVGLMERAVAELGEIKAILQSGRVKEKGAQPLTHREVEAEEISDRDESARAAFEKASRRRKSG